MQSHLRIVNYCFTH